MTEPLLQILGVRKQFGGLSALAGLDLHVNEGEILSVIGPNGAGKSTLFNVITGLYAPDGGDITFREKASSGCGRIRWRGSASRVRSRTCTSSRT